MQVKELNESKNNPRIINDSQLDKLRKGLERYGDLSGVVYNVQLKALVSGHQRKTILENGEIEIVKKFDSATKTGTVALGKIVYEGEEYNYREVEFNARDHNAAMLLANKAGGDWNWSQVGDILKDLDATDFDMDLTGFETFELDNFLDSSGVASLVEQDLVEERGSSVKEYLQNYAEKDSRKIEFWCGVEDLKTVIEILDKIKQTQDIETNSAAIFWALRRVNESI